MSQCIYTGADEATESFSKAEHIFPKCIGGIHTLPKGWVCDRINHSFSVLELGFARQNPIVAMTRMFLPPMGRKKHKNRNIIGIFRNTTDSNDYSLGYISDGIPRSIHQLCINSEIPIPDGATVPIKVVVPPDKQTPREDQIRKMWERLRLLDGKVCIIKNKAIPNNMVLLGYQDDKWYLGLSEQQNGEIAKNAIHALITKICATHTVEDLLNKGQVGQTEHQVHAEFTVQANLHDIMRVYAKIAVNCLARLKGHDYVMDPAFDGLKHAILTGENIREYVIPQNAPNTLKTIFSQFGERLTLGSKYHSATVFYNNGTLYSEVAIYGYDNPYLVKLGAVAKYDFVDCYVCDWENKAEYTLIDCVLQICNYDEESLVD